MKVLEVRVTDSILYVRCDFGSAGIFSAEMNRHRQLTRQGRDAVTHAQQVAVVFASGRRVLVKDRYGSNPVDLELMDALWGSGPIPFP